jgi:4-hydroxyacetophenone monooxygenase
MTAQRSAVMEAGFDEDLVRRALAQAQINVLRIALYQQTGDPELAAMVAEPSNLEGTPYRFPKVARQHHAAIRQKAFEFLRDRPSGAEPVVPSKADAARMMEMFMGEGLSPSHVDFGWEDLAFEGFPRGADWEARPPQAVLDGYHVTIVGAGFSGLLAAIQLQRLGLKFTIVERQAGIGGTWFLNDYPEARVDIPSILYQFKFEQGYPWKSHYATQAELQDYLKYLVDKYGLRDHIRLETRVIDASWDEARQRWAVRTAGPGGEAETLDSHFLISASGLFSTPRLPDIEGIDGYRGKMFHTTAWDHTYDYAGKRVAVIGTGSTGSQLVRAVAEKAQSLTIFQRTPNWVNPVSGYRNEVSPELRWLLGAMPGYANWLTYHHFASAVQVEGFQYLDPDWQARGGLINEKNDLLRQMLQAYIRSKVGDDEALYRKLVPDYAPMSRRLVVDNGWYDTILRDNVELVSGPIDHFTDSGIVSADGGRRDFDLVVLSAGFDVERYLWPAEYHGRNGVQLEDLWAKDGARAHLTMTLPGFPNFLILYGPNAGTVAGSFHSWIEVLTRYGCKLITHCIETGSGSFEVREEVYQGYNDGMDAALKALLLEDQGGGGGYYINSHGRPGVTMPWTLEQWYELIRAPDLAEFLFADKPA